MDRWSNRRYKKLNVKRKTKQYTGRRQYFPATLNDHEIDEKEAGNFKIDRFMKDVRTYGKSSTADDERIEKQNASFKEKLPLKEKVGFNGGKSNVNRREGLFQRGIITKDFNKGLMPPSLSARLNADLQKMIKLANGKYYSSSKNPKRSRKYPRSEDAVWSRISSFNYKQHDSISDLEDSINNDQTDQLLNREEIDKDIDENYWLSAKESIGKNTRVPPSPQKVEAEVQVSGPIQSDSLEIKGRARDDVYLKFTHFVTRSLFNSGVNKEEARHCTDLLKESLIEIYHSRLKEKDLQKDGSSNEQISDNVICPQEESDITDVSPASPVLRETDSRSCPLTSRSEEGSSREKFKFVNDSQLSDDIVVRKPKELCTSGTEFLKTVYGNRDEGNKSHSTNLQSSCVFYPVQKDNWDVRSKGSYNSSHRNDYTSFGPEMNYGYDGCCNRYTNSIPEQLNYSSYRRKRNDVLNRSNEFCEPFTQQYFSDCNRPKYSWNDRQYSPCYSNIKRKTEPCDEPPKCRSPEYISLLPRNHRMSTNTDHNFYGAQPTDKVPYGGFGNYLQTHQSIFSIPRHLPPRTSPEIEYRPRRMF